MKLPKVLKSVLIFLTLLGAGIVFIPTFQGAGNIDVQVQMDSLQINDTTTVITFKSPVKSFIATFQDSSNSKVDSLAIAVITGGRTAYTNLYSTLALHELSQTTSTTNIALLIPGDGVTSSYQFTSETPILSILVYRKNVGGVTGGVGYPYKTNFSIQNEY